MFFAVFSIERHSRCNYDYLQVRSNRPLRYEEVSRHKVVDRGVLQAMWEELEGKDTAINSLSANHAYLKTLYTRTSTGPKSGFS